MRRYVVTALASPFALMGFIAYFIVQAITAGIEIGEEFFS